MHYVYLLLCADGSYYTGYTNRLSERIAAHNGERPGGAKYTRARRPVRLVYFEEYEDAREAMRREYAVKQLSHREKEALASCGKSGEDF